MLIVQICAEKYLYLTNLIKYKEYDEAYFNDEVMPILSKTMTISDLAKFCSIDFKGSSASPLSNVDLYLNGEKVETLVIPDTVKAIPEQTFLRRFGAFEFAADANPFVVVDVIFLLDPVEHQHFVSTGDIAKCSV